jgi:hypothetical protein
LVEPEVPFRDCQQQKENMKKLQAVVLAAGLAAAMSASAGITFSGTALSGLTYVGNPGEAQYVPAAGSVPALAQLYTADSSWETGDSPAVFIPLSGTITLSSFWAHYGLYGAATGPAGTSPYWILYLSDDTGYRNPIVADGGATLNASSGVHLAGGPSMALSLLDNQIDPISGLEYGEETVAWAGVEIGDWDNGDNVIPASANFDCLTVVPEPSAILSGAAMLLPFGASTLRFLRKNRAA